MQESAGDVKEPDVKFLSEAGFGASKAPMTDELISTLEKLIDAVTVSVHSVQELHTAVQQQASGPPSSAMQEVIEILRELHKFVQQQASGPQGMHFPKTTFITCPPSMPCYSRACMHI